MESPTPRLTLVLAAIDQCNCLDPRLEADADGAHPKEWLYGQRMTQMLGEFKPDAGEELQIAARAQHIERWKLPRDDYPANRAGYLQWRRALGKFHAQRSSELMAEAGYESEQIDNVRKLLTKQQLKQDSQVQALEDVICLVFVKFYLAEFVAKQTPEKVPNIIRKTWVKMSVQGQQAVLALPLDPSLQSALKDALSAE